MSELLSPPPVQHFTDNNGNLLTGGKLFTYAAGTTTKLATYTDSTGGTPNTNPVILNTRGEANVWIPPGVAYKFTLSPSTDTDPPTNAFYTVDNITSGQATVPFGIDTGTANAYVVTGVTGISALTAGVGIVVKITHSNTGASNLNVNSLGNKAIGDQFGNALLAGALTAGQTYFFSYNGTGWNYTYFNCDITQAPSFTAVLTGNGGSALVSFNVQATTSAATTAEVLVNIGLTSNLGAGVGAGGNKVALYSGVIGAAGTGDIWATNFLVSMNSGSGNYTAQICEMDMNNGDQDLTTFPSSFGASGLSVTGFGPHKCTAAIQVLGTLSGSGGPMWQYGMATANDSIIQSYIYDINTCPSLIQSLGTYSTAIDLSGSSSSTAAIALFSNDPIVGTRAGSPGTLDNIINYNNVGVLVGNTHLPVIANNILQPSADNTYTLGASGSRWSVVYAATGTINTSDPALKTDIQPLPSALPLIAAIDPIRFRWKVGGSDLVPTVEIQTVHATETVETEEEQLTRVDGVMHATTVKVQRQQPIWEMVPVIDPATGEQLTMTTKSRPELRDGDGNVTREAQPAQIVPRFKRRAKMVEQPVTVDKPVPRAGRRVHWGFDAANVGAVMASAGVDFGGYVKAEDGTLGLRPDQMIPILWKAMQEQQAQIVAMQAELDALKPPASPPPPAATIPTH